MEKNLPSHQIDHRNPSSAACGAGLLALAGPARGVVPLGAPVPLVCPQYRGARARRGFTSLLPAPRGTEVASPAAKCLCNNTSMLPAVPKLCFLDFSFIHLTHSFHF